MIAPSVDFPLATKTEHDVFVDVCVFFSSTGKVCALSSLSMAAANSSILGLSSSPPSIFSKIFLAVCLCACPLFPRGSFAPYPLCPWPQIIPRPHPLCPVQCSGGFGYTFRALRQCVQGWKLPRVVRACASVLILFLPR